MPPPPIDATPRVPRNITKSRIDNFMSGGSIFKSMGIHRALWEQRHIGPPHVCLSVYSVPDLQRIPFKDAVSQTFQPVEQNERKYGPSWSTHWFKVQITIPKALNGKEVVLQWDMGCEGLVWSSDGEPLQGLTGGSDQARHEFVLSKKAVAGEKSTIYIEAACNGMFGVGNSAMVPDPNREFSITTADLVVPVYDVQDLYHDLTVIRGIAYDTDPDTPHAREALWVLNQVINYFQLNDKKSIARCKELTQNYLSVTNGTSKGQHRVTAIGNCHIDTAWLWPYDETKRKVARSWSTQIDLMERYPEYIFTGSQTQQYDWLEQYYPSVFAKIKEKEKAGQWEIIGGSWVEHDTNMPSGESLCRQMLLGQRYYEKHFGKRTRIFWLPDSFGYSSQLPQILRQSGCDFFFTQKLSWNNINKFPLSTFWWSGIDGTHILAHLTPAETYTASVTVSELNKCTKNNHDLEVANQSLLCYGHGDGGGGPTVDMLERLRRLKDVDGLPICKPGSALGFFEDLEKNSRGLQVYQGELYLEFHRGTYTTQALVKKGNRKSEILLRDVEILGTMALLLNTQANATDKTGKAGYSYPAQVLDTLWKLLCLNQFHDCLPGSAIGLAFKDVHKQHREIISESLSLRHQAQTCIMSCQKSGKNDRGVVAFNTLPWARSEVVVVPDKKTSWLGQQWTAHDYEYILVRDVAALSATGYVAGTSDLVAVNQVDAATAYETKDGLFVLENKWLKAEFNKDGHLVQLTDKRSLRAPLVPKGAAGNVLKLYEDVPTYWDAWDVEIYHLQKYKEINGSGDLKILSKGPLKAELQFRQTISEVSWIEQVISLTCIGERIEFDSHVNWHESHQFLKVEFVWDIISDHATYDIQYGVLRRPTHYNTTIDSAKFEVCAHKFADLSESNYGVALLNNCKYGYATWGNVQRLSLLRSPKGPDENADMGEHTFKYAVYPHEGHFNCSRVTHEALQFNIPLSIRSVAGASAQSGPVFGPLFLLDPQSNIILDTIKPAEDDPSGRVIILRLFEAYGGQSTTRLRSVLNIDDIQVSNVLEDNSDLHLERQGNAFLLTLRAFQIVTLKVFLAESPLSNINAAF